MPMTVDATVAEVYRRVKGRVAAVNQSCPGVTLSTAADHTNADLVPAVRKALWWLSLSPADPAAVADSDLAPLAGFACEKFFDAATLEALYLILGAMNAVDEVVGDNQQKLSQIEAGVQKQIGMLEERLRKPYGPNVPSAAMGAMQAGSRGLPNDPLAPCRNDTGPWNWPYPPRGPINP